MTSAALLIAYGVTMGTWGASSLLHARWAAVAPRLAIAAWQAIAASVLLSLVAAGIGLSMSVQHVRAEMARVFDLVRSTSDTGMPHLGVRSSRPQASPPQGC